MFDELHVQAGRTCRFQELQAQLTSLNGPLSLDGLGLSWSGAIFLLHSFAQQLHSIQPALSDEEPLETMFSPLTATCDARSQQLLLQSKLLPLLDLVQYASSRA